MDYIYEMEQDELSDADTDVDPEEASTLSMEEEIAVNGADHDLANELSDSSKCCDVVLIREPQEQHEFEILIRTVMNFLTPSYYKIWIYRYGRQPQ